MCNICWCNLFSCLYHVENLHPAIFFYFSSKKDDNDLFGTLLQLELACLPSPSDVTSASSKCSSKSSNSYCRLCHRRHHQYKPPGKSKPSVRKWSNRERWAPQYMDVMDGCPLRILSMWGWLSGPTQTEWGSWVAGWKPKEWMRVTPQSWYKLLLEKHVTALLEKWIKKPHC